MAKIGHRFDHSNLAKSIKFVCSQAVSFGGVTPMPDATNNNNNDEPAPLTYREVTIIYKYLSHFNQKELKAIAVEAGINRASLGNSSKTKWSAYDLLKHAKHVHRLGEILELAWKQQDHPDTQIEGLLVRLLAGADYPPEFKFGAEDIEILEIPLEPPVVDIAKRREKLAYYGYEHELVLSRNEGDQTKEASVLQSMGAIYADIGDKVKALEYFELALSLYRTIRANITPERMMGSDIGRILCEIVTLYRIGLIHHEWGDHFKALEYYKQAYELTITDIFQVLRSPTFQVGILYNIAGIYSILEDKAKALEHYELAGNATVGRRL
jgi:tetratricopeptide (TPR) repeat protein